MKGFYTDIDASATIAFKSSNVDCMVHADVHYGMLLRGLMHEVLCSCLVFLHTTTKWTSP